MANAPDGQTRDAEYTLFPQPDSPAGRLFGHLVGLQVPGTPIEIALSGLAGAVRIDPDVAAGALSRLATDGLISLDQEPESEHLSVTVMVAPPLDEYGIQPHWWEAQDAPPPGGPPPPEDRPPPVSAGNPGSRGSPRGTGSPGNAASSAPAGPGREQETMSHSRETIARGVAVPQSASEAVTSPDPPPGRSGRAAAPRPVLKPLDAPPVTARPGAGPRSTVQTVVPDNPPPTTELSARQDLVGRDEASAESARRAVRARLRGGAAPPLPTPPDTSGAPGTSRPDATGRGATPDGAADGVTTVAGPLRSRTRPPDAPLDVDRPPALPPATPKPSPPENGTSPTRQRPPGRAATPPGAGSNDDTTLARGFVERFEKLLAEGEEWRRRAQVAEEQVTTTERLLRVAERRAADAEARLATAQERLRGWSELTQRMQQLTRQADTASRGRAPRPKPAPATPERPASS